MRIKLNELGDTIVEVMISVAVLGAIIGGAFSIATRSLNTTRIAFERSEALKAAESQIEKLRTRMNIIDSSGDISQYNQLESAPVPGRPPFYCMKDDLTTANAAASSTVNNLTSYPSECVVSGRYHIAIQTERKPPVAVGSFTYREVIYTVNATWDRSGGGGQEVLYLVYKGTY